MLNPGRCHAESCPELVSGLFQHLFRAGLIQHLIKSKSYETLKSLDPDPESSSG
jgi:hypothetical protein